MYYILRQPSESNIVGVKDGGSQAEFIRDGFKNKNHYDEIINFINGENIDKFPTFKIDLEYVQMRKQAKLTDFISFYPHIPCGKYLISNHVVRILSTFNLPEYKLYPATINFNGKSIDEYQLLYVVPFEENKICDVTKSIFYKGFFFNQKNVMTFKSKQEYQECTKQTNLKTKKLYLNKSFNDNLDYFFIKGIVSPFISSDLKETFEMAGITGIKFLEAEPELYFEE